MIACQTFFKGRKTAICGTTGEIRTPLTILLVALRLRIADGLPDQEDPDRKRHPLRKSVVWRHLVERNSSGSFAIRTMWRASSWVIGLAAVRRPEEFLLVIDVGERLPIGVVDDDEAGRALLNGPGRRKRRSGMSYSQRVLFG